MGQGNFVMRTYFAIFCIFAAACGGSENSGRKTDAAGGGSGFVIDQDGTNTGSDGADGTSGVDGNSGSTADASTSGGDIPELKECSADTDCPSDKPTCAPQGYFPDALKETTMKAYEGAGLGDIFSAKAEMINGRAAMLGMAVFIATATIF